jgi:hypothetical protein
MDQLNAALGQNSGGATTTTQPPASSGDTTLTADITVETGGSVSLNDLNVKPPSGWGIAQKGALGQAVFTAVASGKKYVSIYSVPGKTLTLAKVFGHGAQVVTPETSKTVGSNTWKVIETKKTVASGPHQGTWYVYGFMMVKGEYTYYGFARADDAETARSQALEVLESL